MYFFLDTTKDITFGLLDANFSWLEYLYLENMKGSAQIHKIIFDVMQTHKVQFEDLKGIFQIAGPGSYTGMRVSEGIGQIFRWQNYNVFSFYHFEVPAMVGVESGVWIINAYKGEYFLYSWNKNETQKRLVKEHLLKNDIAGRDNLYTSFELPVVDNLPIEYTSKLLKENPKQIFKHVLGSKMNKSLYYFRTTEEEFKRKDL